PAIHRRYKCLLKSDVTVCEQHGAAIFPVRSRIAHVRRLAAYVAAGAITSERSIWLYALGHPETAVGITDIGFKERILYLPQRMTSTGPAVIARTNPGSP